LARAAVSEPAKSLSAAGASDGADDDVIDDERQPAGYENDLPLHQAERAMKSLRISLQLIGRFGGTLLQCGGSHGFANGESYPKTRSAVH